MDEFRLEVRREKWGEHEHDVLRILINGEDLVQIAEKTEAPFAEREGHPNIAGAYAPLLAKSFLPPSKHFLGIPEGYTEYNGKVALLACDTCGLVDCWPLIAKITVQKDTVVWSGFEQPYRGPHSKSLHWQYDGMGPFVFDKKQYERELENACLALSGHVK